MLAFQALACRRQVYGLDAQTGEGPRFRLGAIDLERYRKAAILAGI